MRKQIAALAASMVVTIPAFAQSSVTLYGILSDGLNYTNNAGGHPAYQLASGYAQGTRIGLRGTEDLGGGLQAIFSLADIFDLNSGKLGQGLVWGRQAFVGLASAKYGTVTLGRQYDSVVDYVAPITANGSWGGYLLAHPYDNDNTDTSFRANNTIKYASPNLAGFKFGGTYSLSNSTSFADNRQMSIGAQYSRGGLLLAAAYQNADNPGATTGGAITNTDASFIAKRMRVFGAGVSYTLTRATLGFAYTHTDLRQPTSSVYVGPIALPTGSTANSLAFQNFEVNGMYQFTPAFFIGAQYVYTVSTFETSSGSAKPKYHTVGLMADYNLSKRTDLYAQAAYMKVAGDATGTILDRAYVPGAAGVSSTANQFVARLGIRHKF